MSGKFGKRSKERKRNMKEAENVPWDSLKRATEDFKEQERQLQVKIARVERKGAILKERGANLDAINIKKPEPVTMDESKENMSVMELMIFMKKKFLEQNEYLDRLEREYDDLLSKRF